MIRTKINKQNRKETIDKAVSILESGGIVIYPTETCYGIAVDATNEQAVSKLREYKSQRGSKPFSAAFTGKEMASKYVELNDMANNLYDNYLPGPITVISKSKGKLAPGVESMHKTVGVRVPDYDLAQELVTAFGKPITATSANVSYQGPPYSIDQWKKVTPGKAQTMVDLVLDVGGLDKHNPPSTVVDTTLNTLKVLRAGSVAFEQAIGDTKPVMEIETATPEETEAVGKQLIEKYGNGNVVIAMKGELGAGKTQLTKGIGQYLGVKGMINSPTYTLINEYPYEDKVLAHMDTWRVNDSAEFDRVGLKEHMKNGDVVVIEWADKFYSDLQDLAKEYNYKTIKVTLEYIDLEKRKISVYEQ